MNHTINIDASYRCNAGLLVNRNKIHILIVNQIASRDHTVLCVLLVFAVIVMCSASHRLLQQLTVDIEERCLNK